MGPDLRKWFDKYNAAFYVPKAPEAVAALYHEPCINARMGAVRLNRTRQDTADFFQQVIAKYRAQGWHAAEMVSMETRTLGTNSAQATIRWAYKNAENQTLWEWTFTYNLYKANGEWKILLQTLHDS
jgi:hypothetical protein